MHRVCSDPFVAFIDLVDLVNLVIAPRRAAFVTLAAGFLLELPC